MKDLFELEEFGDVLAINITRLRLRPTVNFGDYGRITAHYEMDYLLSKVALPYLTGSGMTNRQAVDLNWQISDGANFKVNHFIDMLYYRTQDDPLAGKISDRAADKGGSA